MKSKKKYTICCHFEKEGISLETAIKEYFIVCLKEQISQLENFYE